MPAVGENLTLVCSHKNSSAIMVNDRNLVAQLTSFPEDWREFLALALESWGVDSVNMRRELSGKSGAQVWVIDMRSPDIDGAGILKVGSGSSIAREIDRHRAVMAIPSVSPSAPRLSLTHTEGERHALLMEIPGHALIEVEPLARCRGNEQQVNVQGTCELILKSWNKNACVSPTPHSFQEILKDWLGTRRCGPDSPLVHLLSKHLRLDPECLGFIYNQKVYPNPLALCSQGGPLSDHQAAPVMGFVHGDFHGFNVLVRGEGRAASRHVIDFAYFETNKPLFFDQSYLELNLLLNARESASFRRWHDLIDGLVGVEAPQHAQNHAKETDDQGLLRTAGFIRAAVLSWIGHTFPQRRQDLCCQFHLSRIAAGLNFAAKRGLPDKLRAFAFFYAASAARELFTYVDEPLPETVVVSSFEASVPQPQSQQWREVWDTCGNFDHHQAAYVLIASPRVSELSDAAKAALGRIPWSLVIEFHPSEAESPFFRSAGPALRRLRSVHRVYPHQRHDLDFETATCWLMAEGAIGAEPTKAYAQWRRATLEGLRSLGRDLHRVKTPKPIYTVVLADGIAPAKLRDSLGCLDETMGELMKTILVRQPVEGAKEDYRFDCEIAHDLACAWEDLAYGLNQMFGDIAEPQAVMVPVRDSAKGTVRLESLTEIEVAQIGECFEIVHTGLAAYNEDDNFKDFRRGSQISWREVDLHRDVDRSDTHEAIANVRTILEQGTSKSFAIDHTPGAGGTTLARRIAWELRTRFPCVILNLFIEGTTAELAERLFRRTNLPILIVLEEIRLPGLRRELFFNELKSCGVRFTLLDIRRRFRPQANATTHALVDPMGLDDARRFLQSYTEIAPRNRHSALQGLARDPTHQNFRSAFFFGLYAFEADFLRVEDYVKAHIAGASQPVQEAVAQLALITRFAQERLSFEAFRYLIGTSPAEYISVTPTQLVGENVARLLMYDGKSVAIAHPLLAEEILCQHLFGRDNWQSNLADFCIRFIANIAVAPLHDSIVIENILTNMFISRGYWGDESKAARYADLVNTLPSSYSQRRVLEALCESFPKNAHFWSHLGRQINLSDERSFEEAREKFLMAIELQDDDEIHHHGLGMVYRLEVKALLKERLKDGETVNDRLAEIRPLFEEAEECFAKARKLDPISEYPLVTPIQMTSDTLERLMALRRCKTYGEFLCLNEPASDWARRKLDNAESLLGRLRHLEANSEPSVRRQKCEAQVLNMHGDLDGMIAGLSKLCRQEHGEQATARRMLARAYLSSIDQNPGVHTKKWAEIVRLMTRNLMECPTNGNDIRSWLRAYRMLPEFTLTEAIERVSQWASSDNEDAYYYLYILHFLNLLKGGHGSAAHALRYIDLCKRKAPPLLSKRSFEWFASEHLGRPCRLVHHSEMGEWNKDSEFFPDTTKLGWVEGQVDKVDSAASGTITIHGMPAFFVPRPSRVKALSGDESQFWTSDRNTTVTFHLGFSYEGLRAWNVKRVR